MLRPRHQLHGSYQMIAQLTRDHREFQVHLGKAQAQWYHGPVAEPVIQIARLCLLHFELEQEIVFPLFAMGGGFEVGEDHSKVDQLRILTGHFETWREELYDQHQSMTAALDELLVSALEDGNEGLITLTRNLNAHEKQEEEIVYRGIFLIRNYVQHNFPLH